MSSIATESSGARLGVCAPRRLCAEAERGRNEEAKGQPAHVGANLYPRLPEDCQTRSPALRRSLPTLIS